MHRRRPTSRWALWVFAAALLLKSAMPWLASASADLQGKTLVEVCTVYGVSMVPLSGESQHPGHGHDSAHGGEHCALTALGAFATDRPVPPVPAATPHRTGPRRAGTTSQAPDACAAWVARLKHGPPSAA